MKIKINHPTQQAIEFAHEYLDENRERDELPLNAFHSPSSLIGPVYAEALREGIYDNTEFDIDLEKFNWKHYFILKRFLEIIQETKKRLSQQMSNEMGISRQSHNQLFKTHAGPSTYKQLFTTGKNPLSGGKKRSVRRSRRRVRRTHRRRA